ncbi:MAG: glycosyltransferase family 4 protein [bacterium]
MASAEVEERRRKVLFVYPSCSHGGRTMQLYYLCSGLIRRGWEVHLLTIVTPGPTEKSFREFGVNTHSYIRRGKFDRGQARAIRSAAAEHDVKLINAWGYTTGIWAVLAFPASSKPEVAVTVNLGGIELGRSFFYRMLDRAAAKNYKAVFSNSYNCSDYAARWYGVDKSVCFTVPNGFDFSAVENLPPRNDLLNLRTELGIPENAIVVIQAARIDPLKNQHDMLRAADKLAKNRGDVYFVLIGSAKSGREKKYLGVLAADLKRSNARNNFIIAGHKTNPLEYLAVSDIFLQTSRTEGLSNALIEAMACGLPVVATDVGDTARAVADGETGFLVKTGDVDSMVARILKLAENADLRKKLGAAGRELVRSKYTIENLVELHEREFIRLLDELPRKETGGILKK